jgi:hypothetical protein
MGNWPLGIRTNGMNEAAWERLWAPYDQPTYQAALDAIAPGDVVLEIGAGDLRLARQMALIARQVYAIEIQARLVNRATASSEERLPGNLTVMRGDARRLPFPTGITTGVLLMRHCTHFRLYADKLRAAGCHRLVTNARWRMGVEVISLQGPRVPFEKVILGWYACDCGSVGFKPGPAGQLTPELEATIHEVADCPNCRK